MSKNSMRVAVINNIIAPYRIPLFKAIQDRLPEDWYVDFVFLSKKESIRNWEVDDKSAISSSVTILPVLAQFRNPLTTTSDTIINSSFLKYIHYDVVIVFGYNYLTYILILLGRRMLSKRTILFCESTSSDKYRSNSLKEFIKSWIIGCASEFIVPGIKSKHYLQQRTKGKITIATNAVQINNNGQPQQKNQRYPGEIQLLFVGRLSIEKNLEFALNALAHSHLEYSITIAGTGPLKTYLRNKYSSDNVKFLGEMRAADLANLYRSKDILILPSLSEPWGLVVNEALSHGMPALVSDLVGCGPDLLKYAGKTFAINDPNDFIEKLEQLYYNLSSHQLAAEEISKEVTIEAQAHKFVDAITQ